MTDRLSLVMAAFVVVSLALVWLYTGDVFAVGNAAVGCILAWSVGKRQGRDDRAMEDD